MERLVTTSQAAEILGLSLQGVHYRIKTKQLKSIKQGGKTYVYVTEELEKQTVHSIEEIKGSEYEQVITVKNEQIDLLKKSIKMMRSQYKSEISRLEKNQKRIIGVFNSEIKLLQGAFNEMRTVYKQPQLEHAKPQFMSLGEFTSLLKANKKNDNEIKLMILKGIKNLDKRFIYNKKTKKVLILNSDFSDLI